MRELIDKIVQKIPDYNQFLTVDELNESTRNLVRANRNLAELFEFGTSRNGEKILGLKIGSGSQNALVFGFPHPNEPIGTMMLEFFTKELVENEELRESLDYTWYIIKTWDIDGARLNEQWFKGPYTIYNYARNFFRPAGHQQVDWTFPINYKSLHFSNTIPETGAMQDLIDRIKPKFIYSLHNAGFGGTYWYISEETKEIYDEMRQASIKQGVPLNLGEPEAPYCKELSPAIYKDLSIKDEYDYLENYGAENIEKIIKVGTCSADYAKTKYGSFTLLTELPYFYDQRILDTSETEITRGECIREAIEKSREYDAYIRDSLARSGKFMSEKNPFKLALEAFTDNEESDEAEIRMTLEDPKFEKPATVAEEFDNRWVRLFYRSLSFGLLVRANETEIQKAHSPEAMRILKAEFESAHRRLKELCDLLEENLDYTVIPIRKLVAIQLECGLLTAKYLSK